MSPTCPGLYAAFGLDTKHGEANHTKPFAAVAATRDAFERAMACGKGVALVGWKVLAVAELARQMKTELEEDMKLANAE
jgi:hypothetical protein